LRSFNLVVIGIFLAVGSLVASEVKLKDGTVYDDVKIVARDGHSVRSPCPKAKSGWPSD